jgi:glycosyltransferase involved in cell wall biosynthesis
MTKYFYVTECRIKVIYGEYDKSFRRRKNTNILEQIRSKYRLLSSFILSVGTFKPRKNVNLLLRAYTRLPYVFRKDRKLVFLGQRGWINKTFFKQLDELSISNNIIFTGYMPNNNLTFIYNLADLFMHPSLYEGFGVPPLKTMACDCPVIAADSPSIPEVVRDAEILIDP